MDKISKIRALLRSITGAERATFDFRLMEVVSIDGDLCRAKIGDFELPDVRLSSIGGGSENGILITPAVGSIILVADISCGNLRELNAIGYSEVATLRYHQGKTTITADADVVEVKIGKSTVRLDDKAAKMTVGASMVHIEDGRICLNSDAIDHGGLVKIEELRRSFESLKTYCEVLKDATSASIAAVGVGAAANGPAAAMGTFDPAMTAVSICIENMENENITH